MTLTLDLPPDLEDALAEDARRQGMTPEKVALDSLRRLYAPPLTPAITKREDPTLAIFAQWAAEDPITGPEDAAARQREGDELMASLQANRMNFEGRTDFSELLDDTEEDTPQEKAA